MFLSYKKDDVSSKVVKDLRSVEMYFTKTIINFL